MRYTLQLSLTQSLTNTISLYVARPLSPRLGIHLRTRIYTYTIMYKALHALHVLQSAFLSSYKGFLLRVLRIAPIL